MASNPSAPKPEASPDGVYRPVATSLLKSVPRDFSRSPRYPTCQSTKPPELDKAQLASMEGFVYADMANRRPMITPQLGSMLFGHFEPGYDKVLELSVENKSVFPITRAIAEKHGKWFKEVHNQVPGCEKSIPAGKNRWSNIIPNEVYRVPLMRLKDNGTDETPLWEEDYVSASDVVPIEGLAGANLTYIACQAPVQRTINDMWDMIWQQHVEVIVMLTRFAEQSSENGTQMTKEKAIPYWPLFNSKSRPPSPGEANSANNTVAFQSPPRHSGPNSQNPSNSKIPQGAALVNLAEAEIGATERYGNVQVEVKQIHHSGSTILRTFDLRNLSDPADPNGDSPTNQRTVRLLHFEGWGDHALPDIDGFFTMFRAYHLLRKSMVVPQSPVLVHCSAGIGRTGTFIAIDMMLDHIRHQTSLGKVADIRLASHVVSGLRLCRPGMVQTDGQYSFIYWFLQYCYNHPKKVNLGL